MSRTKKDKVLMPCLFYYFDKKKLILQHLPRHLPILKGTYRGGNARL